MTLSRLTTTHPSPTPEAAERARATAGAPPPRVEAAEGTEADRRRSLRQELDEVEAKAVGPFEGQAQVLQSARAVAERLTQLGPEAGTLVHPDKRPACVAIDAEA